MKTKLSAFIKKYKSDIMLMIFLIFVTEAIAFLPNRSGNTFSFALVLNIMIISIIGGVITGWITSKDSINDKNDYKQEYKGNKENPIFPTESNNCSNDSNKKTQDCECG